MLEKKLDLHYKHCIQKELISITLFDEIKQFILENYDKSYYLNPYKFAEKYNYTVHYTLKIFLILTNGENAILDTKLYIQCQNMECKDVIYIDDNESRFEENIVCTNCNHHYKLEDVPYYTKVYFILNKSFMDFDPIYYGSSIFEIIQNSSQSEKFLPPSIDNDDVINTTGASIEGGVNFQDLTDINREPDGTNTSTSFANRQKRLSRRLSIK